MFSLKSSCLSLSVSALALAAGGSFFPNSAQADNLKLFEVEGRAGVMGFGDYEFAIGENGANIPLLPGDTLNLDWQDGVAYPWSLTWNENTKLATFTVASQTIDYTSTTTLPIPVAFNRYELSTFSKATPGVVDSGTTMSFSITSINGSPTSVTSTATAGSLEFSGPINSGIVPNITTMGGTLTMDWPDTGTNPNAARARSRVGFKLKGFDPPLTPSDIDVPEPSSLLALLATGVFASLGRSGSKKEI